MLKQESNESVNNVRWSPNKNDIQTSWSASVASVIESIAAYDPRPQGLFVKPEPKSYWNHKNQTWSEISGVEVLDPVVMPPPDEVSAADAIGWDVGRQGVDMRPHLFDTSRNEFLLVDSGSQVCTFPPEPGDTVDTTMSLRAVNGAVIQCYGRKVMNVKIGRKSYEVEVIKSDVKTPILGWNFIKRHRLNFEWNTWGDICIVDRKAQIKSVLHYKAVPFDSTRKLSAVMMNERDENNSHSHAFDVWAMQNLSDTLCPTSQNPAKRNLSDTLMQNETSAEKEDVENDITKLPDSEYKTLLLKYPDILKCLYKTC